ncbi:oxidoreductase [Cohnella lupini]|uniref:Probable oxidoreductase n=1 Tax=Cohnella lupini TaxID=1294267 RepID=A0A3D9IBS2_9BACL|nr:oxidoreductase [Cohnella lupini]RED59243.1 NAD(P)-dependent dehydrogenase (short-subunit alcohol dehydrogenase family) [Cohnella lupini]
MINSYQVTKQAPIPSGFGEHTTAIEALNGRNLLGKTAIVTGGYSGLGLETVRVLSEAGATVIVPARTPDKARASLEHLRRVELETLDLMDPNSIQAFAKRFIDSGRPLDILVNSAGIMAVPLIRDNRGYESQFATNHLGHFQLTAQLWDALRKSGNARVVSVSSRALQFAGVDFDDPNFERRDYEKWMAYGQSKSANSLFAVALDRFGYSSGVRAFSVHPGTIVTDLSRHLSDEEMRSMGALDEQGNRVAHEQNRGFKSVEQGAATSVWCATSEQLDGKGGVYCEDVDIANVLPDNATPGSPGVSPWAIDLDAANRLWKLSEEMTGVKFGG